MLRLRIDGMTCQGCVSAVTQAIGTAAPGQPVEVDLASGEILVRGTADANLVAAAIERAGYKVIEHL